MVPPVKMMWTRLGVLGLMMAYYFVEVTIFFLGSTPLAALLPVTLVFVEVVLAVLVELVALVLLAVVDAVAVLDAGFFATGAAAEAAVFGVVTMPAS